MAARSGGEYHSRGRRGVWGRVVHRATEGEARRAPSEKRAAEAGRVVAQVSRVTRGRSPAAAVRLCHRHRRCCRRRQANQLLRTQWKGRMCHGAGVAWVGDAQASS